MARYIIYGAGSSGAFIGGRLLTTGAEVVFIARGPHHDAIAANGLRIKTPLEDATLSVDLSRDPAAIDWREDDVVVLTMRTPDCLEAISRLARVAPPSITVACAASGSEPERMALRFFENVLSVLILINVAIEEPGTVCSYLAPGMGIVDVGRCPDGYDAGAEAFARDMADAGFLATPRSDMTKWKNGRLLTNAGTNVIRAVCPSNDVPEELVTEAREEAARVFAAAGLPCVSSDAILGRVFASGLFGKFVDGKAYPGSSTTQELLRGAQASEIDFVNGEIVLLGRQLGISTPVNQALQSVMQEMLREHAEPYALTADELRQRVVRPEGGGMRDWGLLTRPGETAKT